MKKVTTRNYRQDKLYPRVVKATARVLGTSNEVSPVAILLAMGTLEPKAHDAWQRGQVPYLERVIKGNLSKANRILRIVGFHAHDLNMAPSYRIYRVRGKRHLLRFSKSGDPNVEKSYARHFRWNQSAGKKHALIDKTLSQDAAQSRHSASANYSGERLYEPAGDCQLHRPGIPLRS